MTRTLDSRVAVLEDQIRQLLDAPWGTGAPGLPADDSCLTVAGEPPAVLVDLDGVVADFSGAFFRRLSGMNGHAPLRAAARSELFSTFHWPYQYFDSCFVDAQVEMLKEDFGFWASLPLEPYAEALVDLLDERWLENKISVTFITSRPSTQAVIDATSEWIWDVLGWDLQGADRLVFATDKGGWLLNESEESFKARPWPLFAIDDQVTHLARYQEVKVPAFLWSQPWNEGTDVECARVSSPVEFDTLLDQALATGAEDAEATHASR